MVRKITAITLLLLMTATTVMSQRGLRYCLCLDELFVGECECAEFVPSDSFVDSCHSDACCSEGDVEDGIEIHAPKDCNVDLFLEVAEYSSPHEKKSKEETIFKPIFLPLIEAITMAPIKLRSVNGPRGPPPLLVTASSVPLFLRHSVFLV